MVVEAFLKNDCDYCCNTLPRTFPHGLDTEVFSLDALERVWEEAKSPYEREHVTPYIREDTNKFRRINVKNNDDLTHLRWTLDYPEDFEFITKIYERLYSKKKIFYMQDILNVLHAEHWLVEINSKYVNR